MDYPTLKSMAGEASRLTSGRLTRVLAPWPREVLLAFRQSRILLSADPERPGLFLPPLGEEIPKEETPFARALAQALRGAVLTGLTLPFPGERVLTLAFSAAWPRKETFRLVLETMGRWSNLFLLDESDRILAAARTVPAARSRVRPVAPGRTWTPPPLRAGVPLEEVRAEDLPAHPTPDSLVGSVRGLSPALAEEAIVRNGSDLAGTLRAIAAAGDGKGYLWEKGGKVFPAPFPPGPASPFSFRVFPTLAVAAWAWRSAGGGGRPREGGPPLAARLEEARRALEREVSSLTEEKARCLRHEEFRIAGKALLLHPAEVPDKAIPLDPALSSRENARRFFALARRLKRGLAEVEERLGALAGRLQRLERAKEELAAGDEDPAREFLPADAPGEKAEAPSGRGRKGPGIRFEKDGFAILVGRSSSDNERVTFGAAGPEDLWLHTRDYPSSHVVILAQGREVPRTVVSYAAALAASRSGARKDTAVEVMVTRRKWVRKVKGAKPGLVRVERSETILARRKRDRNWGE